MALLSRVREHNPVREFPDHIFKVYLEQADNLREFLYAVAPDLAPFIDLADAISINPQAILPDWQDRTADLIIDAAIRGDDGSPAGRAVINIAHQSDHAPDAPFLSFFETAFMWFKVWKQWKADRGRDRDRELVLPVPISVVLHSGHRIWTKPKALAEHFKCEPKWEELLPPWRPIFWDLAEQSVESLLNHPSPWMRVLAVVRAEREDPDAFLNVFVQVLKRLEPVAEENEERWKELVRFVLSWGVQRRGADEHDRLRTAAQQVQTTTARKEKVERMGQTIGEYYIAQGELKGKREYVLMTLNWRFPNQVAPEAEAKIQGQESTEILAQWLRSAIQAESWDNFRTLVRW